MLLEQGWKVLVVWECRLKGDRLVPTTDDLVREVRLARERDGARLVELGVTEPWKLSVRRKSLKRAAKRRHR
jgi:DNA mismatch endonuclease (patch repair protein)